MSARQSPQWPPSPWTSHSTLNNPLPESGDPLQKCVDLAMQYDEHLFRTWNAEIQNLLIFAGLFSGIVTAFAIEVGRDLKEEPAEATTFILAQLASHLMSNVSSQLPLQLPKDALDPFSISKQNLRYNLFIYISLILGLSTALVGILCLQWLREFDHHEHLSNADVLKLRQVKFEGLRKWRVPQVMSALPLLLQVALVCFFVGLIDWLSARDMRMAIGVGAVIGAAGLVLLATTVLPVIYSCLRCFRPASETAAECPYKSPQSWLAFKLFTLPFAAIDWLSPKSDHGPNAATGRKFMENLYKTTSWSAFDKAWQYHQRMSLDVPLVWLAETFADHLDSMTAILTSARRGNTSVAWSFSDRLQSNPKKENAPLNDLQGEVKELARDLACYHALTHHIDKHENVRNNLDVFKYVTELYIRISNTMNAGVTLPFQYATEIKPPILRREFDPAHQVPLELKLQLLSTLQKALVSPRRDLDKESDAFWEILVHFVNDSSVSNATEISKLVSILDRIFIPSTRWVDSQTKRILFSKGLLKVMYAVYYFKAKRTNILKIFDSISFKECMNIIVDNFQGDRPHPLRDTTWNQFLTKHGLDSRYIPPAM
ncbi:hypothetical protein BJ165DRAFT_1401868 [Panaeolus papilionaceus]|nr:hypothetical protein BJ165DRAFT_1401868 [Panaeolus papilionaceus]